MVDVISTIYHAAPILLDVGSVILPGNWGRIIKAIGEQHPRFKSEHVFEELRRSQYPHLPSRLNACFACPTETAIRFFVRTGFKDSPCPPVLYEVEKVEPNALEHRADFNLIQANKKSETLEGNAQRYWSAEFWYDIADGPQAGFRCEEIVTASPLRIVSKIS